MLEISIKAFVTLLIISLFITMTGCSLMSNSLEDIQKNPSKYLNKSVTVIGNHQLALITGRNPECNYIIKDKNGYSMPFTYTGVNDISGYIQIQLEGVVKQRTYLPLGYIPGESKEVTDYYIEATDIRSVNWG